jgi:hypothetical protein
MQSPLLLEAAGSVLASTLLRPAAGDKGLVRLAAKDYAFLDR